MIPCRWACSIFISLMVLHVGVATASPSDCDAVLIPTKFSQSLDREQELALAVLVESEADYQKVVKAGASGSYGLFRAGGNFEDFKHERSRLLQQQNQQMRETEAQRVATSYLPPELAQHWVSCRLSANGGVLVRMQNITPNAVTVVVSWRPLAGVDVAHLENVEVRGAKQTSEELRRDDRLPAQWRSPTDRAFILDRVPGQDLRFVIGIQGRSDHVLVLVPPQRDDSYDVETVVPICSGGGILQ